MNIGIDIDDTIMLTAESMFKYAEIYKNKVSQTQINENCLGYIKDSYYINAYYGWNHKTTISFFNEYYKKGIIDRVYASNVSYVPNYIKEMEWFKSVDCSYKIANLISELNYGHSIGDLISCETETAIEIEKLRTDNEKKE